MLKAIVKVVAHPETGAIITASTKNPEWGTFRVDSENVSMENNFFNVSKRSAFIRGKIADLNSLGLKAGQSLPGKIVKRESFEPFYEGQQAKINPSNGETVLTNGRPTYIEFVYSANAEAPDVWVGQDTNAVSAEVANALTEQTV